MSRPETFINTADEVQVRGDRKFSVSANRGQASHRLRYVETGGAAVDTQDCTFCQSTPDLSDSAVESGPQGSGEEGGPGKA